MLTPKKVFIKTKKFISRFKWLVVMALILAIIGSIFIFRPKQLPQFVKAKVAREDITETVNESGNIVADSQADIYSSSEGIVEQIYIKNGSYVYKDSPLFRIESLTSDIMKSNALTSYNNASNAVKQAEEAKLAIEAQLKIAKKQKIDARESFRFASTGFKNGLINPITGVVYSKYEVDSSRAAFTAAEANFDAFFTKYNDADQTINLAKEAEQNALLNYENLLGQIIKSPTNGFVSNLKIAVGDKVTPNTMGAPISPCLIIADTNNLYLEAPFNEIDLPKIKIGQFSSLTFDAAKGKKFNGTINRIDSIGKDTQGVITYNVYIKINNPDDLLKPGMSGDVEVEIEKHEAVLTVPSAAVKPYQNGKAIQVLEIIDNKQELKYLPVEIGLKSIDKTEIINGLSEGQEIVISQINNAARNLFSGGN